MKWHNFLGGILPVLALAACASKPAAVPPSAADTVVQPKQQAFQHVMERYYAVDEQGFKEISCLINVPLMEQMLGQVRGYLTSISRDISVNDTLSSYRMTYAADTGLHIDDPTIDIAVKPGTKLPDPARVEDGRQKMQAGFQSMIGGTDQQLQGIMQILESGKNADYDILYVNETADGYDLSYQTKTAPVMQVVAQLQGKRLTLKTTGAPGVSSDTKMDFDSMPGGKLLVRSIEEQEIQPMMHTDANIRVDYQAVDGVTFPARLSSKVSMDAFQSSHQEGSMEVDLHDCSIRK